MSNSHEYWLDPPSGNTPEVYLPCHRRSEYLLSVMDGLVPKGASILEVGCNAGRNLYHLHRAGYRNLVGIEINPKAVDVMRREFPELNKIEIMVGPMETLLPTFDDQQFDFVFTMVVLVHLPPGRDRHLLVHSHLSRITKDTLLHIEFSQWDPEASYFRSFGKVTEEEIPDASGVFHDPGMTLWVFQREHTAVVAQ